MRFHRRLFFCFSYCKSIGNNDPQGGAIFDPRSINGRIYEELLITLLHTKHISLRSCGFREEDFSCISHYKPMANNHTPAMWPVWNPEALLAGFIRELQSKTVQIW